MNLHNSHIHTQKYSAAIKTTTDAKSFQIRSQLQNCKSVFNMEIQSQHLALVHWGVANSLVSKSKTTDWKAELTQADQFALQLHPHCLLAPKGLIHWSLEWVEFCLSVQQESDLKSTLLRLSHMKESYWRKYVLFPEWRRGLTDSQQVRQAKKESDAGLKGKTHTCNNFKSITILYTRSKQTWKVLNPQVVDITNS